MLWQLHSTGWRRYPEVMHIKGAHAWVEIDYKGTTYVYDPNFQKEYKLNGYKLKYGAPKTLKYIDYRRLN